SGVNLLRPQISIDDVNGANVITEAAILQEPPSTPPGLEPILRSHRIGIGLYDLRDGRLVRRERIETDVIGARTELPTLVGQQMPDLLLLNDGDFTYAKVRLDVRSWRTALQYLGTLEDSLARALIWGAAWDMTRDAETSTGDYLALVEQAIAQERDVAAVQVILRQLASAITLFAADANRAAYQQRLATLALTRAMAAEPASDLQLAFTRAFIAAATSTEHLDIVTELLHGTRSWPGLAVDTDLRWQMVQRLAATGRFQAEQIEAELATDDTAAGRRQAAMAVAGRPTADAKERVWRDVVEAPTDLPNAMVEANIAGFMQSDQRELLRTFRDRYFAALPTVWTDRTHEIASDITIGMFPVFLVEQATVDAADAFLATPGSPSMHRLVNEGRDGVLRAMRAMARDAQQEEVEREDVG
ncbi:MAG: ERAP1-like C-terminal domain-containing protein, partial [Actinomycetales bacterium]